MSVGNAEIPRQVSIKKDLSITIQSNDGIPHNNLVHRGHLLGKQFEKSTFWEYFFKERYNSFFDKNNNIDNISTIQSIKLQWKNLITGKEILKIMCLWNYRKLYLKQGIFESCYYEVWSNLLEIDDKMPIGNRILFLIRKILKIVFMYFVPISGEEYMLKKILCYRKCRETV